MNKKAIPSLWGQPPFQHCCRNMDCCVVDIRVPIEYVPVFREYRLRNDASEYESHVITYCPWCGRKFPRNLREVWLETLASEYTLDPHIDMLYNPELPDEFKDDTWWKNRGL